MKLLGLTLLLSSLLGACGTVENSFTVSDPTGKATAAELRLCGEIADLRQSGQHFSASLPITCEGGGEVMVQLADGQEASCPVGYVTPGMTQHFDFFIEGTQCLPKKEAA